MGKIKLIVHECFAGKQNPEDVFAAVFLSSVAVLTERRYQCLLTYSNWYNRCRYLWRVEMRKPMVNPPLL